MTFGNGGKLSIWTHCLLAYVSGVVNRTVSPEMWSCKSHQTAQCLWKESKSKSSIKLPGWQRCPVWFVLIKGSWVVKQSQPSESPPPHCLKTQHPEFILNSVWTVFWEVAQFWSLAFFFSFLFFLMYSATVEFRSSMDSGVCSQEPSMKSTLALPTKKSVTYPGDFQDTPAKPPLYHKQPPALPPKPFSRIPNHNTGQCSHFFLI